MATAKPRKDKITSQSAKPGPVEAGPRSGYAEQLGRPTSHGMPGAAIPVASGTGKQAGIPLPHERQYGKAKYEVVTAAEAQLRMKARSQGKMPPIKGGLDDINVKTAEAPNSFVDDGFGIGTAEDDLDVFEPTSVNKKASALPSYEELEAEVPQQVPRPTRMSTPTSDKLSQYLSKRVRVTLELDSGDMCLNALGTYSSRYSLTIMLPSAGDGATFIPKPGTALSIRVGDNESTECYFPGTYFTVSELGLIGLVFVLAGKEEGDA